MTDRRAARQETFSQFLDRRRRDAEAAIQGAEAFAHDAYRDAIRRGQDLNLKTPADVMRFGADLLRKAETPRGSTAAPALRARGATPLLSKPPRRRKPAGRYVPDEAWTAKQRAGLAGEVAGLPVGVWRGARRIGDDVTDAGLFLGEVVTPNARGQAARAKAVQVGAGLAALPGYALTHPEQVKDAVGGAFHQLRLNLDPTATPPGRTPKEEFHRTYELGKNQGELGLNLALPGAAGGEVFVDRSLAKAPELERIASFVMDGVPLKQARYFAEPYSGRSHHILAQATRLPKFMGGGRLPGVLMESPLNKISSGGLTKGEFFRKHVGVDDSYHGGKVPKRYGGGGWSAKQLGWRKYGPLKRAWYGTAPQTKAALGAGGGAGYDLANQAAERGDQP